jgi:hypothetical protein
MISPSILSKKPSRSGNIFVKESVIKESAGDCFAVPLTDADATHGGLPLLADSFNYAIQQGRRLFFGEKKTAMFA